MKVDLNTKAALTTIAIGLTVLTLQSLKPAVVHAACLAATQDVRIVDIKVRPASDTLPVHVEQFGSVPAKDMIMPASDGDDAKALGTWKEGVAD